MEPSSGDKRWGLMIQIRPITKERLKTHGLRTKEHLNEEIVLVGHE